MSKKNITHISIIMDGNGRWANQQVMPRAYGHRKGIESISKIVKACTLRQVSELTLFAFSSENWNRPDYEVKILLKLFYESIQKYVSELNDNNIQIKFIGNTEPFSSELKKSIIHAESLTTSNSGLKLNFAINYGGKWDIINSVNKAIESKKSDDLRNITIKDLENNLSLKNPPDLLIRTGGEQRLSNFMLWQHAYTELYFTDCLWPDFTDKDLDIAIKYYQDRVRKYGSLIDTDNNILNDA